MSEEDFQDAAPLLLGHSPPEQLILAHLSPVETQSPLHTGVLQMLNEASSLLLGVKQQHLGGRKAELMLRA